MISVLRAGKMPVLMFAMMRQPGPEIKKLQGTQQWWKNPEKKEIPFGKPNLKYVKNKRQYQDLPY